VVVVTPLDKALKLDTPLLNRHEKRQLTFNLQLQSVPNALELVADLKQWLRDLAGAEDSEDDDVAELEHDAFPGYRGDNDTLLCSLVKMVYSCYPHHEHAEKLAACQRELSWCASADAMVRAKETHREANASYFGQDQCHTSFGDLVKFMLADSTHHTERSRFSCANVGLRAIVHTYSDMSVSIGDISFPEENAEAGVDMAGAEEQKGDEPEGDKRTLSVQEIRLHTIHFESDLKSALESFFFGKHHDLLAIRCAFGQNSFQRRTMAMHLVTEVRNKFVKLVRSNEDGTISPKHVVFVVEQRKGGVPADNNTWMPFDPNWPKVTLDSLESTAALGFCPCQLLTDSIAAVIDGATSDDVHDEDVPEGPNANLIRLCRSCVARVISRINWQGSDPQRLKRLVHILDVPGAQSAVANVVRFALQHKQYEAGKWQAEVAADRNLLLQMRSYRTALATAVLQRVRGALASVVTLLEANGAAAALDRAAVYRAVSDESVRNEVFVKAVACWQSLLEAGIPLFIAPKTTGAMLQHAGAPAMAWATALQDGSNTALALDSKPEFVLPFFLLLDRWLQKHRPTIMDMHVAVPKIAAALTELLSTSEQFAAFRAAGCFHDDLWPLLYHDICLVLATQLAKSGQVSHVPFEFVVSVLEQLVPVVNNPDARVLERIGAAFAAFWSHESLICLLCRLGDGGVREKVPDGFVAAGGTHDIALVARHICSHLLGLVAEHSALKHWATAQEWTADVFQCWTVLCDCLDMVEPDSDDLSSTGTDAAPADAQNIETCDAWLHVARFLYEFGSMVAVPATLSVQDVVEFTTVVRTFLLRRGEFGVDDPCPPPCDLLISPGFLEHIQRVISKLTMRSCGAATDRYQWRGVLFLHLLVGRHINLSDDATLCAAAKLVVSQPFLHEPRTLPGSSMLAILEAALGEDPEEFLENYLMDVGVPGDSAAPCALRGELGAGDAAGAADGDDVAAAEDDALDSVVADAAAGIAGDDPVLSADDDTVDATDATSAGSHDDVDDGESDGSAAGDDNDVITSASRGSMRLATMSSAMRVIAEKVDHDVERHQHMDGPFCVLVATCLEKLAFDFADSQAIVASHPEYATHIIRLAADAVKSHSELSTFTRLVALAGFRGIAKVAAFAVNNHGGDDDAGGEEEMKGDNDIQHGDDGSNDSECSDSDEEMKGGDASDRDTSDGDMSDGDMSDDGDHDDNDIHFPPEVARVLNDLVCSKGTSPGAPERVLLMYLLKCIREPAPKVTLSTTELVVRKCRVGMFPTDINVGYVCCRKSVLRRVRYSMDSCQRWPHSISPSQATTFWALIHS